MSEAERQKLDVMHRLERGELSRAQASEILGLSERQVYRIYSRYKDQGDRGVVHRSRGGHSGRHHSIAIRNKALVQYKARYNDYGPSLFSEVLAEEYGYAIHRETLRRWLIDAGVWKREVTGRKRSKHRKARPRRAELGSMLQLDGSPHNWFEGRNPDQLDVSLLVLIDDASGRTMLRFRPTEDTQGIFELLYEYFTCYGLPQQIYTDRGTVYWTDDGGQTQFQRAMEALGIRVLYANSPQAKGRVERANKTHQDRLIKAMRQKGISTMEAANAFLQQDYTAKHNRRYAHQAGLSNIHRSVTEAMLERALSIEEVRTIHSDYTITVSKVRWQITKPEARDRYSVPVPGSKVKVRVYLDGSLHVFAGEQELKVCRVIERLLPGEQRYKVTGRKKISEAKVRGLISKHTSTELSLSNAASAALLKESLNERTSNEHAA